MRIILASDHAGFELKELIKTETVHAHAADDGGKLYDLFNRYVSPLLRGDSGSKKRRQLFIAIVALIVLSSSLVVFKVVIMK